MVPVALLIHPTPSSSIICPLIGQRAMALHCSRYCRDLVSAFIACPIDSDQRSAALAES
jgi:hypothetical protein